MAMPELDADATLPFGATSPIAERTMPHAGVNSNLASRTERCTWSRDEPRLIARLAVQRVSRPESIRMAAPDNISNAATSLIKWMIEDVQEGGAAHNSVFLVDWKVRGSVAIGRVYSSASGNESVLTQAMLDELAKAGLVTVAATGPAVVDAGFDVSVTLRDDGFDYGEWLSAHRADNVTVTPSSASLTLRPHAPDVVVSHNGPVTFDADLTRLLPDRAPRNFRDAGARHGLYVQLTEMRQEAEALEVTRVEQAIRDVLVLPALDIARMALDFSQVARGGWAQTKRSLERALDLLQRSRELGAALIVMTVDGYTGSHLLDIAMGAMDSIRGFLGF